MRDYNIIIQFDLYLARHEKSIFNKSELDKILDIITKTNNEKNFCWNFFIKHNILTISSFELDTYFYNLEKIQLYKPYKNFKTIVNFIKKEEDTLDIDFNYLHI